MRELLRLDPLEQLGRLPWRGEGATFAPAFDVYETKDAYVFKADMPGIKEQDLELSVTGNRLTVSGKREVEEVTEQDRYYCAERSHGTFMRTFTLPEDLEADKLQAELKEGVLLLRAPKRPEAQPKKISLRAGASDKAKA